MKLYDSELKAMEVLWQHGELPAKQVAGVLEESTGWNKNTTYTVLKKLVAKGAIERREPNFICRPLVSREQVRQAELDSLIDRVFDGSADLLFASLLSRRQIPAALLEELKRSIDGEGEA